MESSLLENKPPDPHLPYYKTIKTSLANVLKLRTKQDVITDAVKTTNKIVARALFFLKLYLLLNSDSLQPIVVNADLVDTIFKTLSKAKACGRPPSAKSKALRTSLKSFYDEHFVTLLPADDVEISYTNLSTVLDYAALQIVTVFENNIQANFVGYVESFVNAAWQKDDLIDRIRKRCATKKDREAAIRKLTSTLRKIKTDLLNVASEPLVSHPSYHAWIRSTKPFALPDKSRFEKDSIYYDLKVRPGDYHPAMLRMTRYLETAGKKSRSFCPLRTTMIPKHICIDTTSLVNLLYTSDFGQKSKLLKKGELVRNKDEIWSTFFRTDKKLFNTRDYVFNHMIDTDGVSACIQLIRRDLAGKRAPKTKRIVSGERYVDDMSEAERNAERDKKVVGIDPNMSDLLYCVDESGRHFRYTQNGRRQETKVKKYSQIHLNEKSHTRVDGRTVIEWEADLSRHNHRSTDLDAFKEYVKAKLSVIQKTEKFYSQRIFRKLKLSAFWNVRRSEQWMLSRFANIFGGPTDVTIGIGDWEQKKHRKFKEPVKGKGFRSLLRRGGYRVHLVDEFRTSCQCSHCRQEHAKCEKFRIRNDPNTKKDESKRHLRLVHGLLKCKICNRLWNRDVNSAINISRLTREALDGNGRLEYLSRARPAC